MLSDLNSLPLGLEELNWTGNNIKKIVIKFEKLKIMNNVKVQM